MTPAEQPPDPHSDTAAAAAARAPYPAAAPTGTARLAADEPVACEHSHAHAAEPHPLPAAETGDLDTAALMLQAMSDTARLRLLLRLAEGERCVSELVQLEGEKLSTLSARLQVLLGAKLVVRRREARHMFYSLADEHVADLLRIVLMHAAEDRKS